VELHTFSVVARDPHGAVGVAVCTARPNVGSLVPWVSLRGAIATQARVDTNLGRHGIALLDQDVAVDTALLSLLGKDPEREKRQVHGVDLKRGFVHTGKECVPWAGHEQGPDYSVAGNMLAGPQVIGAMAGAFRRTASLELAERRVMVLEAGQAAGGDKRGKQSAALLIASPEPRMYHNLRVDDHTDPVAELRRVFTVVQEHVRGIEKDYGAEGVRLFGNVKW
jgi:uncharacterized Ntn-hydrolase superfamily protein